MFLIKSANSQILCLVVMLCLLNAKPANSQSIKTYYELIHKGETAFNQDNYTMALAFYEQAFERKKGLPFAYDLFHYGYIACKAGQYAKAEESFTKLIRLGLSPSFFANFKDPVIGAFFQTEKGNNFLKIAYHLPLFETVKQELREEIYQRRLRDQYFRLKPNGYELFRDSIVLVDHHNGDFLKELIQQYNGFPDESILGIDSMEIDKPLYFILLLHQSFGSFSGKFGFSNEIKESIKTGRLHNIIGGELLEKSLEKFHLGNDHLSTHVLDSLKTINVHNPYKKENFPERDVCVGYQQKSDYDIAKIDINRAEIYLVSMKKRIANKKLYDMGKGMPAWVFIDNIYVWTNRKDFENACSQLVKQF